MYTVGAFINYKNMLFLLLTISVKTTSLSALFLDFAKHCLEPDFTHIPNSSIFINKTGFARICLVNAGSNLGISVEKLQLLLSNSI